jgi:hypothetical protein
VKSSRGTNGPLQHDGIKRCLESPVSLGDFHRAVQCDESMSRISTDTGLQEIQLAKAVRISYTLAGRRLPRGMNSYDASTGLRAMAQSDAW